MDSKAHKSFTIGYGDVKTINIGFGAPLVFFGGPCAIESRDHAFKMAESIGSICDGLKPLAFKSSMVKKIRFSQFSTSPYKSRIVLDLKYSSLPFLQY